MLQFVHHGALHIRLRRRSALQRILQSTDFIAEEQSVRRPILGQCGYLYSRTGPRPEMSLANLMLKMPKLGLPNQFEGCRLELR